MALAFLPASVLQLGRFVSARWRVLAYAPQWFVGACLLLAALQGVQIVRGSYVAGFYGSTRTAQLESYFLTLPTSTTVFFYEVPEAAFFASSRNYYQYFSPHPAYRIGDAQLERLGGAEVEVVFMQAEAYTSLEHDALLARYQLSEYIDRYAVLTKR